MSLRSRSKPSRLVRAIIFLAVLMLLPLALAYYRQADVKREWLQAEERIGVEMATEQAVQATLESRKAYVQTDAYVEEAARAQLKMARPGEVVIIVVTPRATLAAATAEPEAVVTRARGSG